MSKRHAFSAARPAFVSGLEYTGHGQYLPVPRSMSIKWIFVGAITGKSVKGGGEPHFRVNPSAAGDKTGSICPCPVTSLYNRKARALRTSGRRQIPADFSVP
jgi:hypothetical protein